VGYLGPASLKKLKIKKTGSFAIVKTRQLALDNAGQRKIYMFDNCRYPALVVAIQR